MGNSNAVTIYGRTVPLAPIPPGEEVVDVIVVARTRKGFTPQRRVSTAVDQTGKPAPLTTELRYLVELGLRQDEVANRLGATRMPST